MDSDDYRGEAMDWKHLLAYITGTVDQELTFRTLFRTAEAILAEPLVERGAGARYRLCHAL